MSSYFTHLPKVFYKFGDEVDFNISNNLSVYVDLLDQIKNEISFYETFNILDGERPDTVSQNLYGTPNYHWTLYLLNDSIRELGWPLTDQEIEAKAKTKYPHQVLITESNISEHFLKTRTVTGTSSGATGKILKRNLDLGQIFVKVNSGTFGQTEDVTVTVEDEVYTATLKSNIVEYNAVHSYKNSSGEFVDIDPYSQSTGSLIPTTYRERLINSNDELKTINIIKPASIEGVVREWKKLLRV